MAVSLRVSNVLVSGAGNTESDFDGREGWEALVRSRALVYNWLDSNSYVSNKTYQFQSIISTKIVVTQLNASTESSKRLG